MFSSVSSQSGIHMIRNSTYKLQNISHLLYANGFLYVAGINEILQLRDGLEIHTRLTTGPNVTNIFCPDGSLECQNQLCKYMNRKTASGYDEPTDICNQVKLSDSLVKTWAASSNHLYICYNTLSGGCEQRPLANIRARLDKRTIIPGVVGSDLNAAAVILPDIDYIILGIEKSSLPLMSPQSYAPLSMRSNDFTPINLHRMNEYVWGSGALRLTSSSENYRIKYHSAFHYPSFNQPSSHFYFSMVQGEDMDMRKLHTRLGRICPKDYLFRTYVEVTLRCHSPLRDDVPEDYNVLTQFQVVTVGAQLASQLQLADPAREKVIFATFQSYRHESDESQGFTLKSDTALCLYPMKMVEEAFNDAIDKCLKGTGQKGPPHYTPPYHFAPSLQCAKSALPRLTADNFCSMKEQFSDGPISGSGLSQALFALLPSTSVTGLSISVVSEIYTVLMLTTSIGEVIKMEMLNPSSAIIRDTFILPNDNQWGDNVGRRSLNTVKPLVAIRHDATGENVYIASKNEVFLLALSDCSIKMTCSSCVEMSDPFCGWCVSTAHCTTQAICQAEKRSQWIPYGQNTSSCPAIDTLVPQGIREDLPSRTYLSLRVNNVPQTLASSPQSLRCIFYNSAKHPRRMRQLVVDNFQGHNFKNDIRSYDSDYTEISSDIILFSPANVGSKGIINCQSPSGKEMPIIPVGQSNVSVDLILTMKGIDRPLAQTRFYVYRCSNYTDCISCTQSEFPCSFCVTQNKCIDADTICTSEKGAVIDPRVVVIVQDGYPDLCPAYKMATNHHILPSGNELEVRNIELKNVHEFMTRFRCEETCTREIIDASKRDNTIDCIFTKLILAPGVPAKNCTVMIKFDDGLQNYKPLAAAQEYVLEMYDCAGLAQHCDDCSNLPSKYSCGWCTGSSSCLASSRCAEQRWLEREASCPDPNILQVSPSIVTLDGSAIITVFGRNLGNKEKLYRYADAVMVRVERGPYQSCAYIPENYIPYKQFQCRLPNMTSFVDATTRRDSYRGYITLRIYDSSFKTAENPFNPLLTFAVVHATSITPMVGPMAGGTDIEIHGTHLNAGNKLRAFWVKSSHNSNYLPHGNHEQYSALTLECDIYSVTSNLVSCKTSPLSEFTMANGENKSFRRKRSLSVENFLTSTSSREEFFLQLQVDSSVYLFPNIKFTYGPDPTVFDLNRKALLRSGVLLVIVRGTGFDLVANPLFRIVLAGNSYSAPCEKIDSTLLKCATPSLPDDEPSSRVTYEVEYGFIMDRVENLLNKGKIKIFANPIVNPFSGVKVISFSNTDNYHVNISEKSIKQAKLHLNGAYDEGLLLTDVRVTLTPQTGKVLNCSVVGIGRDNVECEISIDADENVNSDAFKVEVTIGDIMNRSSALNQPLVFVPGMVVFQIQSTPTSHTIIYVVLGIFVLILVPTVILILVCRRRGHKRKAVKQRVQIESEIAKECTKAFLTLQKEMSERRQNFGEIPYLSYQDYCRQFLIQKDQYRFMNETLSVRESHPAEKLFSQMEFLKLLITTVSDSCDMREDMDSALSHRKRQFSALLSIILHKDLPLYTKLLFHLIENIMKNSRDLNLLFVEPADSVPFHLLANWFIFLLYPCVLERVGDPLFTLYSALLTKIREGPVDIDSHLCRYTINFRYLLNMDLKETSFRIQVYDKCGTLFSQDECLVVNVLDVDAIDQVKEKILDVHYKNRPKTRRVKIQDLDLYLLHNPVPQEDSMESTSFIPQRKLLVPFNDSRHLMLKDYKVVEDAKLEIEVHVHNDLSDGDSSYSTMPSRDRLNGAPSSALNRPATTPEAVVTNQSDGFSTTRGSIDRQRLGVSNDTSHPLPSSFHANYYPTTPSHASPLTTRTYVKLNSTAPTVATSSAPPSRRKHLVSLSLEDDNEPNALDIAITNANGELGIPLKRIPTSFSPSAHSNSDGRLDEKGDTLSTKVRPKGKHRHRSKRSELKPISYYTCALRTKMLVQMYLDDLMDSIFTSVYRDKPTPPCIKYFFDFLDSKAMSHSSDPVKVRHLWKKNSLCMRYWLPLITNPECIFDIDVKMPVVHCLRVISTVVKSSCSLYTDSIGKDTFSEEQLFALDVERYNKMVRNYYDSLRLLPSEKTEDFQELLRAHTSSYSLSWSTYLVVQEIWDTFVIPNQEMLRNQMKSNSVLQREFESVCTSK